MAESDVLAALSRLYRAVIAHDSQSDNVPNYQWLATLNEKAEALRAASELLSQRQR